MLSLSCLAVLPACSAEGFYRSWQQSRIQECYRLPVEQQAHCLSLYNTSYEEYRRERETAQ